MSLVTLVSGGIDSTLVAILAKESGIKQYPLFIDYGQICKKQEWEACYKIHIKHGLPRPKVMNISGFGKTIFSGLTNSSLRVNEDAFLPGRNLLFLLMASAYAYQTNSQSVSIGLLSEKYSVFPDQTRKFLDETEKLIQLAMGRSIKIVSPLIKMSKKDVMALAKTKRIENTYSCHSGSSKPCGICISCLEIINAKNKGESNGGKRRRR